MIPGLQQLHSIRKHVPINRRKKTEKKNPNIYLQESEKNNVLYSHNVTLRSENESTVTT